jgi:hypothetical protein
MDAFADTPFARTAVRQTIKTSDRRSRLKHKDSVELPPVLDTYVSITTPIDAFHKQLIRPRIDWFNEDITRAQSLLDSLLPAKGEAPSLRLIDHLVVQYAREHSIMIQGDNDVPFDLWSDYRRKLGSVGKKYFDIFKVSRQSACTNGSNSAFAFANPILLFLVCLYSANTM